jgi:hypothetical protein
MNLICEKCGPERVEETLPDFKTPKKQTMNDYVTQSAISVTRASITVYKHRIQCLDCGYAIEFTR